MSLTGSCPSTLLLIFLSLGLEFAELLRQVLRLLLVVLGLGFGCSDACFEVGKLLREGLFDIVQFCLDLVESGIQILLAGELSLVVLIEPLKLKFVALLKFMQLLVLLLDLLFFLLDELLLLLDLFSHILSLPVLLFFIVLHVLLQVLFDFLDVGDFLFLLVEHLFGLLKLRVLVT